MNEQFSIRGRIASGYALVLGVAVAGATVGLLVGNSYQKRALAALQQATAERALLSDLQVRILYNHPTKQLSPYLNNSARFRVEIEALLERVATVQTLLAKRKALAVTSEPGADETQQALNRLLLEFEVVADQFHARAEAFALAMVDLDQMPESVAKQELLTFVQSSEFANFIEFPTQLIIFSAHLEEQEQLAAVALQQASILRMQIIVASLMLSVAIAALIALYTSKLIVQPLEKVISVAQQVTKENDFDLQVPTTGVGDMGRLATALNQLIRQVRLLLQQLGQKNADLSRALKQVNEQQVQLVQSEKMSSLGQLVAGVAHEINNPMNFIQGNLAHVQTYAEDLLALLAHYQTHYPNPSSEIQTKADAIDIKFIQTDLPKILASMEVGTERIDQIIRSLRNFSRMDEATAKRVDLHEGIDSTLLILKQHLCDIEVIKRYGALPVVDCYPGQLNQVFMNVLANAIDALTEHKPQETIPPQITIRTSLSPDGKWVAVAIADNGPGIPNEIQHRIFDPFFTTKAVGKGTGLGMSISYQIITEKHGGILTCHSQPGQGTEFIIQVPTTQIVDPKTVELTAI
ncbi:MAG: ATP-binding protein [Cyanobacteria bacterium J06554_1]